MKNIVLIIIALTTATLAETTYVSGSVSGVWHFGGNPYILTSDCHVEDGESLIVKKAVKIVSADSTNPSIYGNRRLNFQGTVTFPISIKGITVVEPSIMKYCIIESCFTGVINPDTLIYSEVRYCNTGVKANYQHYNNNCLFTNIHHCNTGTDVYYSSLTLIRCFLHSNSTASYSAPDEEWFGTRTTISYCTYAQNELSMRGSTVYWPWEPYYGETFYSKFIVSNSLICDSSNGYHSISNSYYPFDTSYYNYEPCFRDTLSFDYSLADTSPYIDLGADVLPPDLFFGWAPDLGAFENLIGGRPLFEPTFEKYSVNAPETGYGFEDTFSTVFFNRGNRGPDSISIGIGGPYTYLGTGDSLFTPQTPIDLFIRFAPVDCRYLNDSLIFQWWCGDSSGEIVVEISAKSCLMGAVAGTLHSYCPETHIWNEAYIPDTSTFVIEPGCVVLSEYGWKAHVYGSLIAIGNQHNPITFRSARIYNGAYSWGIEFEPGSSGEFKWSDLNSFPISSYDADLSFHNCNLQRGWLQNVGTLRCGYTRATFDSCTFKSLTSEYCPAGSLYDGSVFKYENCKFLSSRAGTPYGSTYPGVIRIHRSSVDFRDCFFKDNLAGAYLSSYPFGSEAFFVTYFSYVKATNCIFDNDGVGSTYPSRLDLINCTFRNVNEMAFFGEANALNCIFSGDSLPSTMQNCVVPTSAPVVDSASLFFGYPTYVSDSSYMLLPTSLGIDNGAQYMIVTIDDTIWAPDLCYFGNNRPYGLSYDIGAYEYDPFGIDDRDIKENLPAYLGMSIYPNPFNSAVTIAIDGVGDGSPVPFNVEIYDVAGRLVDVIDSDRSVISSEGSQPDEKSPTNAQEISRQARNDNINQFFWRPAASLPSGVYLVRARFDTRSLSGVETTATKRVVYLK